MSILSRDELTGPAQAPGSGGAHRLMVAALRVLEQATHRVVPHPKFIKLPSIPDVPDEQVDIIAAMFVAAVRECAREEIAASAALSAAALEDLAAFDARMRGAS